MITQKRMIIPIFNYKLSVVIYDDWDEVSHLDSDENRNYPPKGFTKWQYGSALVAVDAKHGSTIVHEAEHVKNLIWELSFSSVLSYFNSFIFQSVLWESLFKLLLVLIKFFLSPRKLIKSCYFLTFR